MKVFINGLNFGMGARFPSHLGENNVVRPPQVLFIIHCMISQFLIASYWIEMLVRGFLVDLNAFSYRFYSY
jgi:hypothetical protein